MAPPLSSCTGSLNNDIAINHFTINDVITDDVINDHSLKTFHLGTSRTVS